MRRGKIIIKIYSNFIGKSVSDLEYNGNKKLVWQHRQDLNESHMIHLLPSSSGITKADEVVSQNCMKVLIQRVLCFAHAHAHSSRLQCVLM